MPNPRIYTVGGTVQASGGIYIIRQADADLLKLCEAGSFAYVLSARQVGKSSLMVRTTHELAEKGVRCVTIDLNGIGTNLQAEQWYRSLLFKFQQQLNIDIDVAAWWGAHSHSSNAERFARFLEEVVLAKIPERIVCFIDEIDTTLSLDFTDDFFGAIRHLYNLRAAAPELNRLSFVLIGVATPSQLIKDPSRTPFNIGEAVQVTDFTFSEALPLTEGLGLPVEQKHAVLEKVLAWTSGHPYLTQRLFRAVVDEGAVNGFNVDVNSVAVNCFLGPNSIKDNNLVFVRRMLKEVPQDPYEVLTIYRKIRRGKIVPDDEHSIIKSHLKLSGLVKNENDRLRVRNRVYKEVFDDTWVLDNMPDAEKRRERAAFRRGILLASTVAALVIGLVAFLAVYAHRQTALAEAAAAEERVQRQRADKALSVALEERQAAEAARAQAQVSERAAVEAAHKLESAIGRERDARRKEQSQRLLAQAESANAKKQTALAENARSEAERAEQNLRKNVDTIRDELVLPYRQSLYSAYMALSQEAYNDGNIARGLEFLNTDVHFGTNKTNLFEDGLANPKGFEWYYLWHLYHSDQTTLHGSDAEFTNVVYSPDGKTVAASAVDNTIYYWNTTTRQRQKLMGHAGPVRSLIFLPDSKTLASGGADGTIKLWDTERGVELPGGHKMPAESIEKIRLSPNGTLLAIAVSGYAPSDNPFSQSAVVLWNLSSHQTVGVYLPKTSFSSVSDIVFSADAKVLFVADDNGGVTRVDPFSGHVLDEFKPHGSTVNALAMSPNGKILATAGDADDADKSVIKLWDLSSCSKENLCPLIDTLEGHKAPITALAFSRNGRKLASSSRDKTAKVWDIGTLKEPLVFKGHTLTINSLAISPDEKTLATASADQTVKLWDLQPAPDALTALPGLIPIAVSANGRWAAFIRPLAGFSIWNLETGKEVSNERLLFPDLNVGAVISFSPDGDTLAIQRPEGIRLYNMTTWKSTLIPEEESVQTMGFSPDGSRLITAGGGLESQVKIWNAASGDLITPPFAVLEFVSSVAMSKDNTNLAVGTIGGGIRFFDVDSKKEVTNIKADTDRVYAVAFSPDNSTLAFTGANGTIKLLDLTTQKLVDTLERHEQPVTALSFSTDGQTLISGSLDGTIKLWNISSRQQMLVLKDNDDAIRAATISADGSTLVAMSSAGIKLWRGATVEQILNKRLEGAWNTSSILPLTFAEARTTSARLR